MINKQQFTIDIQAGKSQIWKALWDENSYRAWASVFYEGSYAVTDNWKTGSKVLFLSPDQDGIFSNIEAHIPNEVMQFKHIGTVVNGKEQPIDSETKKWTGAIEIYRLIEGTDYNTLTIEIDILDEHLEFMSKTFPKALEKVKSLALSF